MLVDSTAGVDVTEYAYFNFTQTRVDIAPLVGLRSWFTLPVPVFLPPGTSFAIGTSAPSAKRSFILAGIERCSPGGL